MEMRWQDIVGGVWVDVVAPLHVAFFIHDFN
ncbi:uncharacterized protein G2W53_020384 [Senna tora]|uniref:Uncharacterized protein n=1 Tax=Senna tora TaxID=362788 RepID=A0A834WMV4_9FABA|nr:uncharacterized protein G2W53_020384 [Senna tora]